MAWWPRRRPLLKGSMRPLRPDPEMQRTIARLDAALDRFEAVYATLPGLPRDPQESGVKKNDK